MSKLQEFLEAHFDSQMNRIDRLKLPCLGNQCTKGHLVNYDCRVCFREKITEVSSKEKERQ